VAAVYEAVMASSGVKAAERVRGKIDRDVAGLTAATATSGEKK
jgi:hypothetical protein